MFVIVCYDMPDDRRRNRVSQILEGFGVRVQKSVFECDLDAKQLQNLKQRLTKVMKPEDGLRYYFLCATCIPRIEVTNGPPVTKTQLYFAV